MFDVLVESTSQRRGARTWVFFAASSVVWMAVLTVVSIAGVFAYDGKLDAEFDKIGLIAVVPPAPAPPAPAPPRSADVRPVASDVMQAVTVAPREIAPPRVASPAGSGGPNAIPGGLGDGSPDGVPTGYPVGDVIGSNVTDTRPAPPPEPPADPPRVEERAAPAPQRPVSRILSGIATHRVEPRYPQIAAAAGIKGDVVVEVVVSETGQVISTRVLSGHATLRIAAEQAARQWRFTPTILGDRPVKVVGTITFAFKK